MGRVAIGSIEMLSCSEADRGHAAVVGATAFLLSNKGDDEAHRHHNAVVLGSAQLDGSSVCRLAGENMEDRSLPSVDRGSREPQLGSDKVRARRLVRTSASSTRVEDGQRRTGLAHESPHTAEVDARVCQRAVWEFLCRKIVVASPLLVLEGASC